MKKLFALLLAGLMMVGCSSTTTTTTTTEEPVESEEPVSETVETTGSLKMGLGSVTSISASDATEDKDGSVEIDTTYASVVLDGDVIVSVYFDVAQNTGKFGTDGVVTSVAEETPTKKEKGDAYGMKSASGLGLEIDEQMANLEAYLTGKTVDEAVAVTGEEEDLLTGVTVKVGGYISALQAAIENATEVENVVKVATASVTSVEGSDATEDKDGSYEADTTYVFVGLDADDKIAYINYDVAQNSGKYNTEGVVTASEAAPTKKEKGDAYGMKSASKIGLEWFEQCAKFEEFATGKTIEEVVNVDSEDEDLRTGTTITITAFLNSLDKAMSSAVSIE